ncbi:hypothetical protein ACTA71_007899 [Dictyostelium dimigraforme]
MKPEKSIQRSRIRYNKNKSSMVIVEGDLVFLQVKGCSNKLLINLDVKHVGLTLAPSIELFNTGNAVESDQEKSTINNEIENDHSFNFGNNNFKSDDSSYIINTSKDNNQDLEDFSIISSDHHNDEDVSATNDNSAAAAAAAADQYLDTYSNVNSFSSLADEYRDYPADNNLVDEFLDTESKVSNFADEHLEKVLIQKYLKIQFHQVEPNTFGVENLEFGKNQELNQFSIPSLGLGRYFNKELIN